MSSDDALQVVLERWFLAQDDGEAPDLFDLCGGDAALEARVRRALALDPLAARRPAASPGDSAPGLDLVGEYRILGLLGRGGMGSVYLAEQRSLGRQVALKMLDRGTLADPRAVLRFRREAEIAASLEHPNIVPIHAVGEVDGCVYLAMKRLTGPALDRAAKPLVPDEVARIGVLVASALEAAHLAGIVHRDIKPANIILDGGIPRVVDFGLARSITDHTLTEVGVIPGTLPYLAPELLVGQGAKALDPRVDVYALGATLFELATGAPPYTAGTPQQLIAKILTAEPPAMRLPAASRDLETIVLRALEHDVGRRFASAGAMAAELQRFADGAPILSSRRSPLRRVSRTVRRHAWLSASVAVAALALLAAGAVTIRATQREARRIDGAIASAEAAIERRDFDEALQHLRDWPDAGHPAVAEVRERTVAAAALDSVLVSLTTPFDSLEAAELSANAAALRASDAARLWPRRTHLALALVERARRRTDAACEQLALASRSGRTSAVDAVAMALGLPPADTRPANAPASAASAEETLLEALALRAAHRPTAEIRAVLRDRPTLAASLMLALVLQEAGEIDRARGILDGLVSAGSDHPQVWRLSAYHAFTAGDDEAFDDALARVSPARWNSSLAALEVMSRWRRAGTAVEHAAARTLLAEHLERWPGSSHLLRADAAILQELEESARARDVLAALQARDDLLPTERELAAADELMLDARWLPPVVRAAMITAEVGAAHRAFLARWRPVAAGFERARTRGIAGTYLSRSELVLAIAADDAEGVRRAFAALRDAVALWVMDLRAQMELGAAAKLQAGCSLLDPTERKSADELGGRTFVRALELHEAGPLRLRLRELAGALWYACTFATSHGDVASAVGYLQRFEAAGADSIHAHAARCASLAENLEACRQRLRAAPSAR